METISLKTLKQIAIAYFVAFGMVNLVATWVNTRTLHPIDYVLLLLAILPLAVNKQWLQVTYGILGATISLIIGLVCLSFHLNPNLTHTSNTEFLMGYLMVAATFISSLILVYAALSNQQIDPQARRPLTAA